MFKKLNLLPSSGEGRETHSLLSPIERANLNQCSNYSYRNTSEEDKLKRGKRKIYSKKL
jgi:hypothetical protein